MKISHPYTLLSALLATSALAICAQSTHASYYFQSNLSSWLNQAGAPATRATLFDYLPSGFPTQEVPGSIFADLGVNLSSSAPLQASCVPTTGIWWINPTAPGASIEIRFDTPQTAVFLNTNALLPNGNNYPTQFGSTKSYYSGDTLIASTVYGSMGIISTVAIDRVVVTPNEAENGVYIGPTFYFVPAPGALALVALAPAVRGGRRRRE
jgi:hypothetical protein